MTLFLEIRIVLNLSTYSRVYTVV